MTQALFHCWTRRLCWQHVVYSVGHPRQYSPRGLLQEPGMQAHGTECTVLHIRVCQVHTHVPMQQQSAALRAYLQS